MSTDDHPLTGAQFARQVGADPEKWAAAFAPCAAAMSEPLSDGLCDELVGFFRDAMEAAVKAAVAPRWDQQYSVEDLEAAVKAVTTQDWDRKRTAAELWAEIRRILSD